MKKSIYSCGIACLISFSSFANDNDWQFEVTPYLWAVAQNGDTGVRNVKDSDIDLITELDMSTSDILKNLDSGFLLNASAKNDKWLLFIDTIYMKVGIDKNGAGISGIGNNKVKVSAREQLIDMVAGYNVYQTKNSDLYLYGGMRYADVETSITADFTPLGIPSLNFNKKVTVGDTWVDPLVGAYSNWQVSKNLAVMSRFEVGGFGVGSDNSWLIAVGLNQTLNKNWSLKYSYRYLAIDYDDNDFVFDVDSNGLLIGATYTF